MTIDEVKEFYEVNGCENIKQALAPLKEWHNDSYMHSLRVATNVDMYLKPHMDDTSFFHDRKYENLPPEIEYKAIIVAAALHDIGKLCVDIDTLDGVEKDENGKMILDKYGLPKRADVTDEQQAQLDMHPIYSAKIIDDIIPERFWEQTFGQQYAKECKDIVMTGAGDHHIKAHLGTRYDRTLKKRVKDIDCWGYGLHKPERDENGVPILGDKVSVVSRIITVCDETDAIRFQRSYNLEQSIISTIDTLLNDERNKYDFDVNFLLAMIEENLKSQIASYSLAIPSVPRLDETEFSKFVSDKNMRNDYEREIEASIEHIAKTPEYYMEAAKFVQSMVDHNNADGLYNTLFTNNVFAKIVDKNKGLKIAVETLLVNNINERIEQK